MTTTIACQRQQSENAQVTISMPQQQKASASSSCDPCLKFLAVNVSGEGIPVKIYANKEHNDFSELGTQISGEFNLEIPSGKQRFFQLIAAYADSDGELEVHYGTARVDLTNSVQVVEIPLASQGHLEGGHISGRYLNTAISGPTGRVNINLNFDGTSFTLLKTNILNGWFDFFASKNFAVSYELENGTPLLSNIKLDVTFSASALSGNQHVVRVERPENYYRWNGSSWQQETEKDTDIVIGYFFSAEVTAAAKANKIVCKTESTITNLNNLSSDGVNTDMDYNPTTSGSGDIRAWGGVTTSHASCSIPPNETPKYGTNTIYVSASQFDGMGNDNAKSMQGAFSMVSNTNGPRKYSSASTSTYTFRFLPGLANIFFDSARLYSAPTQPNHKDDIVCEDTQLSALGYSPIPSTTALAGDSVTFTLAPPQTLTGHILICPTKSGQLVRIGGMYVGTTTSSGGSAVLTISDGPMYTFADTVFSSSSSTHTFTISNTGSEDANALSVGGIGAPFSLTTTCGSSLPVGNDCEVTVTFAPTSAGTFSDILNVTYHDGFSTQATTRNLGGNGVTAALLAVQTVGQLNYPDTNQGFDHTKLITIINNGGSPATSISGLPLPAGFSYSAGGNYPGGGTCGNTLANGATCTISVVFAPATNTIYSGPLNISYDSGAGMNTITNNLTGTGTL